MPHLSQRGAITIATTYDIGDVARISSTFGDTGGTATNPTQVSYRILYPDGSRSTFQTTTTSSTDVQHLATGSYFMDILTTASGSYQITVTSTGNIRTGSNHYFIVRGSYAT